MPVRDHVWIAVAPGLPPGCGSLPRRLRGWCVRCTSLGDAKHEARIRNAKGT